VTADATCSVCGGLHVVDADHLDALCHRQPAPAICACEDCCGWVAPYAADHFERTARLLREVTENDVEHRDTVDAELRFADYLRQHKAGFPIDDVARTRDLASILGVN